MNRHRRTCSWTGCTKPTAWQANVCSTHYDMRRKRLIAAGKWRGAPERTPEEQAEADALVARLKGRDDYDLARYCEQVLSDHLPGIEVRPLRSVRSVA